MTFDLDLVTTKNNIDWFLISGIDPSTGYDFGDNFVFGYKTYAVILNKDRFALVDPELIAAIRNVVFLHYASSDRFE